MNDYYVVKPNTDSLSLSLWFTIPAAGIVAGLQVGSAPPAVKFVAGAPPNIGFVLGVLPLPPNDGCYY